MLPVHGDTHDVREDSSAGSDQAAHHCHHVVVQHEALGSMSMSMSMSIVK